MPGKVVHFNTDKVITPYKKRANSIDDAEPPPPVKRPKVPKVPKAPRVPKAPKPPKQPGLSTKRNPLIYVGVDGDDLENNLSASSGSEGSESEYEPRDAEGESDGSDGSVDIEPLSPPFPKQIRRPALDPLFKKRPPPSATASSRRSRSKHPRKKKHPSDKSASLPDSVSLESEGAYAIPRNERDALVNQLTRERAKRLLEAIDLPQAHELSPDERRTAHQILTRGCMPAISRFWDKDLSTLPESLFFASKEEAPETEEGQFLLKADKGTEFHAIRAFQELLKISGVVRDHCNILETSPELPIKRSIEKYLRWALSDAHVRVQPTTVPVHLIYCKKKREGAKQAFDQAFKGLETLAGIWRSHFPVSPKPGTWPSVMGFVVCGPVLSVVTLDCDPNPQTETQGMRLLGQFDLSDLNNDVWNTLAVAISVMHVKRTMTKLAKAYKRPFIAPIVEDETKCGVDIDI